MLQRRRIDHRGNQACDHGEMAIFDLAPMRRKYTADRECTLQRILSTSNVIGLIVSFLTSHSDHFEFSNEFTKQYSYPRP